MKKWIFIALLITLIPILSASQEDPIPPFQKIKAIAITKGALDKDSESYNYGKNIGEAQYFFRFTFSGKFSGTVSLAKRASGFRTLILYSPRSGYTIFKGKIGEKEQKGLTEQMDKMVIWDIAVEWLKECNEY